MFAVLTLAMLVVEVNAATFVTLPTPTLHPTFGPPGTQVTLQFLWSSDLPGAQFLVTFANDSYSIPAFSSQSSLGSVITMTTVTTMASTPFSLLTVQASFSVPNLSPGIYNVTLTVTTLSNVSIPPAQFIVFPNQLTTTITTTTTVPITNGTHAPDPGSVVIGTVAGAGVVGVVGALAAIQVLTKNSAIRALEEGLSQLRSQIRSQSPSLGSFNVEVRTGVRRLEDSP